MRITKNELTSIISQFNPWWKGIANTDLPEWKRAAFHELFDWVYLPCAPRAVLLSGARRLGKTTLLLQSIKKLLEKGVPASNILYVTFDHPLIKMAGIELVLQVWREREPIVSGPEYLFLDEAQFMNDIWTWVKHQVDFNKNRRIIFTGSVMPLRGSGQESGVGRWHTIKLTTLSFCEYLEIRNETNLPQLPELVSLKDLLNWDKYQFQNTAELAKNYIGPFYQYLIRGGFPESACLENILHAQRLIREDIIDKALKQDVVMFFGVRNVLALEQIFLYLCMHDGCLLDIPMLCSNLGVKRPTAQHFVELLEATHLIYQLKPFGYGKNILRAKFRIYFRSPSMAPSILLKDINILDDTDALETAMETSVFNHLFIHSEKCLRLTYWLSDKKHGIDLIMESHNKSIPFGIKYRHHPVGIKDLKGFIERCQKEYIKEAFIITSSIDDFGIIENYNLSDMKIVKIPSVLLCYWAAKPKISFLD